MTRFRSAILLVVKPNPALSLVERSVLLLGCNLIGYCPDDPSYGPDERPFAALDHQRWVEARSRESEGSAGNAQAYLQERTPKSTRIRQLLVQVSPKTVRGRSASKRDDCKGSKVHVVPATRDSIKGSARTCCQTSCAQVL